MSPVMTNGVELVAGSEDEALEWYARSASRRAVRRHVAREWSARPWLLAITAEHVRPASDADGDALAYVENGWRFVCEPGHAAAIPVWRVELRDAPAWYYDARRRLRALHPAARALARTVLWGGHVTRESTWLDRLLLGRWHLVVRGDRQLRVGEARWQWCDRCRAERPHSLGHGRPLCDAPDHYARASGRVS